MTVPGGRQVESGKTAIAPGKTQKVVVNIPTKYIKTKDLYTKNVEVETNDPDASVVKLTMRLRVMEILAITPAQVNFGKVKTGSTSRQEITILNKGKDTITLTRIVAVPDSVLFVAPQGERRLDPGKSMQWEVVYKPSLPDDRFLGTVQIETSLESLRKVIRVSAEVVSN